MKVQNEGDLDVVFGGVSCRDVELEAPLDLPEVGVVHRDGHELRLSALWLLRHFSAAFCVRSRRNCRKYGDEQRERSHVGVCVAN